MRDDRFELEQLAGSAIASGGQILGLTDQAVVEHVILPYYRALPQAGRRHMVDVGAAYGGVAEVFLNDGWTADLLEPDPTCQGILQRLVPEHGPRLRIFPFSAAVHDPEAPPFHQTPPPGFSGPSASPFGVPVGATPAPTARLDSFLASHGVSRLDFLKIDTEGNDFVVL